MKLNSTFIFACSALIAFSANLSAVEFSPKHIYLLKAGTDRLWGSYIVGVEKLDAPSSFFPLVPLNTIDFRAGRGTNPQSLSQAPDGTLSLAVDASAQTQVFTLDFFVAALGGVAELNLRPNYDLKELVFLIPEEAPLSIRDSAGLVEKKPNVDFIGRKYIQYAVSNLKSGQKLDVQVKGLKIGRGPLWWIALLSALILVGLSLYVAFCRKVLPAD